MNADDAYAIAWHLLTEHPERYNAVKPPALALYVYQSDEEIAAVPLGEQEQWRAFAGWAAEQGGELARLAETGATDPFRTTESLQSLQDQLSGANVPEVARHAADTLLGVLRGNPDAEGLMVSAEDIGNADDVRDDDR